MKRQMILAATIAVALAACVGMPEDEGRGDPPDLPEQPIEDPVITIEDQEFKNGTVTIEEGTTVTWVWEDAPVEHNVVFDDFESPLQGEGTYTHTFDSVGVYEYHCEPHPFMTGTINVVDAEESR
jgi:plastocyanin